MLAKRCAAALDKLENNYDLFILDLGLPDMSSLDIARFIRKYKALLAQPRLSF